MVQEQRGKRKKKKRERQKDQTLKSDSRSHGRCRKKGRERAKERKGERASEREKSERESEPPYGFGNICGERRKGAVGSLKESTRFPFQFLDGDFDSVFDAKGRKPINNHHIFKP